MGAMHMVEAVAVLLRSTAEAPAPEALAQTALSSSTNTPPPRFLPPPARAYRSPAQLPTPHLPPQWPSPTPRPPTSPTSSSRPGVGVEEVVALARRVPPMELQVIAAASEQTLRMPALPQH